MLPDDFDYGHLPGLSNELKAKLSRFRPRTLGDAERIEGMTPSALVLIGAHLRQYGKARAG